MISKIQLITLIIYISAQWGCPYVPTPIEDNKIEIPSSFFGIWENQGTEERHEVVRLDAFTAKVFAYEDERKSPMFICTFHEYAENLFLNIKFLHDSGYHNQSTYVSELTDYRMTFKSYHIKNRRMTSEEWENYSDREKAAVFHYSILNDDYEITTDSDEIHVFNKKYMPVD